MPRNDACVHSCVAIEGTVVILTVIIHFASAFTSATQLAFLRHAHTAEFKDLMS